MTSRLASRFFFAQHGLAVDKNIDAERPLSQEGITQTQAIAQQLLAAGVSISKIFHSGKLRAQQTADIFASTLAVDDVADVIGFSPNDDVKQTLTQLTDENALYVGHLPHLDKLASLVASGNEDSGVLKFQNSAVVCLEKDTNKDEYSISWYLSYSLLSNQTSNL